MDNYFSIKNLTDIDTFIEKTNALHDGYIIDVEFRNDGIIKKSSNCYEFDYKFERLKIRVLITSMQDAVLEMVFENIVKWRMTEDNSDITDTAVCFDDKGYIVWSDDAFDLDNIEKNDSYVIAEKMKWRFL